MQTEGDQNLPHDKVHRNIYIYIYIYTNAYGQDCPRLSMEDHPLGSK